MISSTLRWQSLLPDSQLLDKAFSPDSLSVLENGVTAIQPRLVAGLTQLSEHRDFSLMLLKGQENQTYIQLIATVAKLKVASSSADSECTGWLYRETTRNGGLLIPEPAPAEKATFPFSQAVVAAEWVEQDTLFGCVRQNQNTLIPEPGLLHQANGGTLILPIRSLLAQPLLWRRLKLFISQRQFQWLSPDKRRPLPVPLSPLPLSVNLILFGDRDALAEFQSQEPELSEQAVYTEIEEFRRMDTVAQLSLWGRWVSYLANQKGFPQPQPDFLARLYREGTRYSGEQYLLPICPCWLNQQLMATWSQQQCLSGESLQKALDARHWREGYLQETLQREVSEQQHLLVTSGELTGQINALSVLDLPGHPRPWGEPSRISCVVHYGDGEVMDVERKAELGGNLHAKGMMIIEAWLAAELALEQQLPFSASMVFEQSYSEVDGDSASLAELCLLISALASQPLSQTIAVTGSVDQLGNVQPVGGLNEKIEGFFEVCRQRQLTGTQGVILPESNLRNLSLSDDVIHAIRDEQFHLWPVRRVEDALKLMTGQVWDEEDNPRALLAVIRKRIEQALHPATSSADRPWIFRWLNWFNQR